MGIVHIDGSERTVGDGAADGTSKGELAVEAKARRGLVSGSGHCVFYFIWVEGQRVGRVKNEALERREKRKKKKRKGYVKATGTWENRSRKLFARHSTSDRPVNHYKYNSYYKYI